MNKILIIEDDADIRELILESLTDQNYEIIMAASGQNGLDKAQKYLPDAIVSDIDLPGLNGYEVFKALRQNPVTVMIPFIFLTSLNSETERAYAIKLGVDDYLNKPCSIKELKEAIAKALNLK